MYGRDLHFFPFKVSIEQMYIGGSGRIQCKSKEILQFVDYYYYYFLE